MKYIFLLFSLSFSQLVCSQESVNSELPYQQIPEYPEDYSSGNVTARMIDGLGFRYYWGSKDLTENDLTYKPSEDGKTTLETLEHLHGLSNTILNACLNKANIRSGEPEVLDYPTMRANTLQNLQQASQAVAGKSAEELSKLKVIFQRGENISDYEFWHLINGPLSDAIYHTGQIVAFRRASGNPLQSGVNQFRGTVKE